MSLRAPPPAESDLLCEFCGYILNGLQSEQGNCPECGSPTRDSVEPGRRIRSPIEQEWSGRAFWRTTSLILFRKRRFFRETRARSDDPSVRRFGSVHRIISGACFGVAGAFHAAWMAEAMLLVQRWDVRAVSIIVFIAVVLSILAIFVLSQVTRLASWLTSKEGAFWGMRLPMNVVQRAMSFHAANYLPVAALTLFLTVGYRFALMLNWLDAASGVKYLVALCVLVVASAIWLFESYVIAMRRIRLANF